MKRLVAALLIAVAAVVSGCGWIKLPPLPTLHITITRDAAVRPSPTPPPTRKPAARATKKPAATATPTQKLTKKQLIAAFREIAFNSEYNSSGRQIRKWTKDLKVAVHGSPTDEDSAALKRAMNWLNGIQGFPGVSIAQSGVNVDVYFVTLKQMPDVIPGYVSGNWGYFTTNWNSKGITKASVAIATDVTDQEARNHLIFEELIQSTGLMQDLYDYPDSIFYGEWTTVQAPAPMDRELMRMLYMNDIKHGMTESEAVSVLDGKFTPYQ